MANLEYGPGTKLKPVTNRNIPEDNDAISSRVKSIASKPTPQDISSRVKSIASKPAPNAPTAKPVAKPVVKSAPRESDASKASRMAAYEDWVKTNRDPMTKEYLTTGMKKGGKVSCMKSGGAVKSKIDGCAQRGKTRGKYC